MEMKEAFVEDGASIEKGGLLQSIKVELVKIREENETLKSTLGRLINKYKSLEVHYHSIIQQKGATKNLNLEAPKDKESIRCAKDHEDLVLSLNSKYNGSNNVTVSENARNSNLEDSFDQEPKDKEKETWSSPSKTTNKSNGEVEGDDQETAQPTMKRARVSVRARCDAPTMNDGCQWRKYGQKIAKGNPCPRGYYRCTVVTGCPVRKQVQRCAEDPAILITTYEGTHNHPLPDAATAMASTTSAAASMLLSGSTSSTPVSTDPYLNHHLPYTNHTANVYPSHALYTLHSYPTIMLDLTKPTPSPHAAALPAFNPYNLKSTLSHNAGLLLGQSYLPSGSTITAPNIRPEQSALTDTLAKAIVTNPNFQSVLAAALTSYVGGGEEAKCQAPSRHGLSSDHGLKWGEHLALGSKHSSDANVTGVSQDFATRSGSLFLDSGTAPMDKNKYLT